MHAACLQGQVAQPAVLLNQLVSNPFCSRRQSYLLVQSVLSAAPAHLATQPRQTLHPATPAPSFAQPQAHAAQFRAGSPGDGEPCSPGEHFSQDDMHFISGGTLLTWQAWVVELSCQLTLPCPAIEKN